MTVTITSTARTALIPGPVLGRVWEGATADGVRVVVYVAAVGVAEDADLSGFDRDLVPLEFELREPLDPERN